MFSGRNLKLPAVESGGGHCVFCVFFWSRAGSFLSLGGCCHLTSLSGTVDLLTAQRHSTVGYGHPWGLSDGRPADRWGRLGFHPWAGKTPWRREWQPTLVFLPRKSRGQRSLMDYCPWDHTDSNAAEWLTLCVCVCAHACACTWELSHSIMSDSATHRLEPARLLCPWDSSGKYIGVGCHSLLQGASQSRDPTCASCIGRQVLYPSHHLGSA